MERRLIKALLLSCLSMFLAYEETLVAPSQGQAGTNFHYWLEGSGPFDYTNHYLSQKTGIVLSLYSKPEQLRNFAPNLRGIKPQGTASDYILPKTWEIEYFCEPDYVLGIFPKDSAAKIIYFNRVRWEKSLYFDATRNRLVLSYRHTPEQGLIHSALDENGKREIGKLETDMSIRFSWFFDDQHLDVNFSVRNKSSQPRNYTFVAQDAAYLWFPDQAQVELEPFLFRATKRLKSRFQTTDKVQNHFSGLYSPKRGVFSGFRSVQIQKSSGVTARLSQGVSNYYLLVPSSIPVGYQLPLEDHGRDFSNLIETSMLSDSDLLNRYAAFELRNVQPNDSFTISFQLIMGLVGEGQTLETRVEEVLNKL